VQLGFYGQTGEIYVVNEQGWKWSFRSGRTLVFLSAPYCHFAGSIMTWDERTKTLFSGDLFGAMTAGPELYADENPSYVEAMKSFHEHFMPSREILKAVTNSIRSLDVALIAPQHGRIIRRDIRQNLDLLRSLECGSFMGTTSAEPQDFSESSIGQVMQILNRVIGRLAGIFSPDEVRAALLNSPFTLREGTMLLEEIRIEGDYVSLLIEQLVVTKEMRWFTLIEPYLFAVLYDQKTGLYNGAVFRQFLATILERSDGEPFGLAYFSIDNLEEINQLYGRKAGDDALKAMVYVLKNNISSYPSWNLFTLDAPYFACIADKAGPEVIREMAEKVRLDANDAEFAAAKLVVSAGIPYDGQGQSPTEWRDAESIERRLLARLFTARKETAGGICDFARDESEDALFRKKNCSSSRTKPISTFSGRTSSRGAIFSKRTPTGEEPSAKGTTTCPTL
jgi:GGDEF domain-containing protein